MEGNQCFQRVEMKYILSQERCLRLRQALEEKMAEDGYGISHISSVYFDTPDHRMIRQSMERPAYKEKLRLRCYGTPEPQDDVFVELKKKYKGIVYKRRVGMPLREAEAYLYNGCRPAQTDQVLREVDYLRQFYGALEPSVWIGYQRVALYGLEDPNLRITFDWDLRWRSRELRLNRSWQGECLLPAGERLMEVKLPGAMPLWMARLFDSLELYPTAYSKYGTAYRQSAERGMNRHNASILLPDGTKKGLIVCA